MNQSKKLLLGGIALVAASATGVFFGTKSHAQAADKKAASCILDMTKDQDLRSKPLYKKYKAMFDNRQTTAWALSDPANPKSKMVKVNLAPVQTCFAEGTPPEVVAAFMDSMRNNAGWTTGGSGSDYFINNRWSGTAGTPRALTWSFVPDSTLLGSGAGEPNVGSNLFSGLDAAFSAIGGRAKWISLFGTLFARWNQVCGLSYSRITTGGNDWDDGAAFPGTAGAAGLRGDLRIGMHVIDGGSGILAYNYFPSTGDMVIDGGDTGFWAQTTNNHRFFRNVLTHEHGHGNGTAHVCPANGTKLMEPFINTSYATIQQDDMRAGQQNYGDKFEPNSTLATAFVMGAIGVPSTTTYGNVPADATFPTDPLPANGAIMSINSVGTDVDYYQFSVATGADVTATVNPIGSTYLNGVQNGDGSCSAGTNLNTLALCQLKVSILNAGGTVLSTATAAAAGSSVATTATGVNGTFNVLVDKVAAPASTQLYKLVVSTVANGGSSNHAPVLTIPATLTGTENTNIPFTATATDSDAGQTLTFSLSGAPAGASINPTTGVFAWTPTESQGGSNYTFSVIVTDNGSPVLSDTKSITITVNEDNQNPTITNVPATATINEGVLYSFDANVTDPDIPAQTMTFSLIGAPAGTAINASSGVFAWTPTEAQGPGNYTFTVRVSDNGSPIKTSDASITITVNEVNAAPVLAQIANQTINEQTALNVTATATDNDLPANALTYSLVSPPTGMTINASTGAISWTPTEAQGPNVYTITYKVTDNGTPNLSDTKTFTVTVNEVNIAPTLAQIANQTVVANATMNVTATATDLDLPANTLTYSLVTPPTGVTINAASGAISWTPTNGQVGVHTITYRVTDNGTPNLNDTKSFQVTVNPASVDISGHVTLNDFVGDPSTISVVIEIRNVGSLTALGTQTVNLDAASNYSVSFTGIAAGNYDIACKPIHWLRKVDSTVAVSASGATGVNFTVINGDCDGDNVTSVFDYIAMSNAFDSVPGDGNWDPNCDLDGDLVVSIFDYIILSTWFDLQGDD